MSRGLGRRCQRYLPTAAGSEAKIAAPAAGDLHLRYNGRSNRRQSTGMGTACAPAKISAPAEITICAHACAPVQRIDLIRNDRHHCLHSWHPDARLRSRAANRLDSE